MKQILQNISNGKTIVEHVPTPAIKSGHVLVESVVSLISPGTERMLVDFGRASYVDKARQQPDKVRMALEKARTDGIFPVLEAIKSKLDQPMQLGYSNVGIVRERGHGVQHFAVGDRIVSNGPHAEVVCVPTNLSAKIPDSVSDEQASFTVLAAIGLQGIRLADPKIGEAVVVMGLGVIGLLSVQMLRAQGCRVMATDFDATRLSLAEEFGAQTVDLSSGADPVAVAAEFSRGNGVDAVLITATTESSEPVSQAATMSRKRGRIILVGVTGLELSRADFYEKELTFQVSCSYGPGRYDADYEQRGKDYPLAYVRWTEQRNFEAVLDLMADGSIDVSKLITHRFSLQEAAGAYELLVTDRSALGILLEYSRADSREVRDKFSRKVPLKSTKRAGDSPSIGVIGAGNYAGRVLLPAFRKAGATILTVVSNSGVSGLHHGRKAGGHSTTTDPETVFSDSSVDAVVIATPHDSHATYVIKALESGKHVFVEKPLCLSLDELDAIQNVAEAGSPILMVGFNRRFSPLVVKIRQLLSLQGGTTTFVMTVNAGSIPAEHWTQDPAVGGGRIVGEGCHFIDLLCHLADSPVRSINVALALSDAQERSPPDTATIVLQFENGSTGTLHYFANGHRSYPKERLEVFCGGRILQLDNWRRLRGWGWSDFSSIRLWRQDKGQTACVNEFLKSLRDGSEAPISLSEILEVSRLSIEAQAELAR